MKKRKQHRWTLTEAGSEFACAFQTLNKRVKSAGIIPGTDGMFSTAQICAALHDDEKRERARKAIAERKLVELALAQREREMIRLADAEKTWADLTLGWRQAMLQLPAKLSQQLPFAKGAQEMEDMIRAGITETMLILSRGPDYFPGERAAPSGNSVQETSNQSSG